MVFFSRGAISFRGWMHHRVAPPLECTEEGAFTVHPYRGAVVVLIGLMLMLAACGRSPGPSIAHHGSPDPQNTFPYLLWEAEVPGGDVRLALCDEAGILMLYWGEEEGHLALFALDGSSVGRSAVPGTLHAGGFRSSPGVLEILYQNREGRIVSLGFSDGKRVPVLFEEPYPWRDLAPLSKGPLTAPASDEGWRYRVELEVTPEGGVLRVTITGPR